MRLMLVILAVFCGVALGQQQRSEPQIAIVRSEADNPGDGRYRFNYEGSDGTRRDEQGEVRALGADKHANTVTGEYSWTSPEGQVFSIKFVSDENGYRPVGDHLPK